MKRKLRDICLLCFMLAAILPAAGEILMYDGFPIGNGGYSTTDKKALKNESQPASQFTTSSIFGFNPKNWQNSTGVIYSFTSGLSLPASFADLPSAVYVGDGRCLCGCRKIVSGFGRGDIEIPVQGRFRPQARIVKRIFLYIWKIFIDKWLLNMIGNIAL